MLHRSHRLLVFRLVVERSPSPPSDLPQSLSSSSRSPGRTCRERGAKGRAGSAGGPGGQGVPRDDDWDNCVCQCAGIGNVPFAEDAVGPQHQTAANERGVQQLVPMPGHHVRCVQGSEAIEVIVTMFGMQSPPSHRLRTPLPQRGTRKIGRVR